MRCYCFCVLNSCMYLGLFGTCVLISCLFVQWCGHPCCFNYPALRWYSLALSCGSENVLILISLLSLMMFLVVLDDFIYLFFWPCHTTCGISVPYPGIEPRSWQWKSRILTTRPPGISLFTFFFFFFPCLLSMWMFQSADLTLNKKKSTFLVFVYLEFIEAVDKFRKNHSLDTLANLRSVFVSLPVR